MTKIIMPEKIKIKANRCEDLSCLPVAYYPSLKDCSNKFHVITASEFVPFIPYELTWGLRSQHYAAYDRWLKRNKNLYGKGGYHYLRQLTFPIRCANIFYPGFLIYRNYCMEIGPGSIFDGQYLHLSHDFIDKLIRSQDSMYVWREHGKVIDLYKKWADKWKEKGCQIVFIQELDT